ncbi:hypothetical protein EDF73_1211, partial [Raoultella sp. BIGb0138]
GLFVALISPRDKRKGRNASGYGPFDIAIADG